MSLQEQLLEKAGEIGDRILADVLEEAANYIDKLENEKLTSPPKSNNPVSDVLLDYLKRSNKGEVIGIAIAATNKDGTSCYNFNCDWKGVNLIGEVECMKAALVSWDYKHSRKII